ncbi:hypothetical protein IFM61606_06406 [Aspergillus udagawae]|nr:hypothetical protein IFM61606_06406 [Aspergillus udagawae]
MRGKGFDFFLTGKIMDRSAQSILCRLVSGGVPWPNGSKPILSGCASVEIPDFTTFNTTALQELIARIDLWSSINQSIHAPTMNKIDVLEAPLGLQCSVEL